MNCPECGEHVQRGRCEKCGWKEGERQGLPTWQGLKPYTKPNDDDVCGEWLPDGTLCQKTVREHIEEFRAIVAKPGTLFTRPSQRDPEELERAQRLEARRQMLARQAEIIAKL